MTKGGASVPMSESGTSLEAVHALTAVLLAADPGSQDEVFDAALAQLEQLLPAGETHETASLHAAALSLRLGASRLRHRESQLQAMLHTAQQLLSSSAIDEQLDVILGATRNMLSSDVAHLNLLRPDGHGHERLRATEGELTEAFRRYRTPAGAGVTGMVCATKSPYVATDYLTDTRIKHHRAGDAAVVDDGVCTMVGVPLLRGNEVIGVLLASYRSRTHLTTEQLSIMASLASLAALSLESARVIREKEDAIRQLRQVNDLVRETNSTLEWSSSMHDRLIGLLLSGDDLTGVAREVREAFRGSSVIVDAEGAVLAAAPPDAELALPTSGVDIARTTGRLTRAVCDDGRVVWMSPAIAGAELLAVVAVCRDVLTDVEQRTLERAGVVSALLLATQRSLVEVESRNAAESVDDLLSGGPRAFKAARRAHPLGLDTSSPCVVLVADGGAPLRSLLQRHARVFARARGGLVGERAGRITLILPGTDPGGLAEDLAREGSEPLSGQVNIGAGGPATDSDGLARAFQEALRCVVSLQRLGVSGRVATPLGIGFAGLLLGDTSNSTVGEYVARTIGPVLDYDRRRGSKLIETIVSYFAMKGSLRAAANAAQVHPNTVHQRLQRVAALLGPDWLEPDRALEIQLALRLHQIAGPVGGE